MKLASLFIGSCCLVALMPVAQAQETFTFDTKPTTGDGSFPFANFNQGGPILYTDATLSPDLVQPGTTAFPATFSVSGSLTPAESYQYVNAPGTFTLSGGTTYLANVDDNPTTVLTITFAHPITSISLDFEVNNFTANNIPDASLSLNGDTGTGSYDPTSTNFEGTLSYAAAPFTVATLSFIGTDDNGYGIDNITVSPATGPVVPEPGAVAFGAAGLLTAGLLRRRKK